MKEKLFIVIIICSMLAICSPAAAQSYLSNYTFRGTSLDVTSDARSAAMGESFVANSGNSFSFFENPAALPMKSGVTAFYTYRSNAWASFSNDARYYSVGLTAAGSFGNLGFALNEYQSGQLNTLSPENDKNKTFIVSYSHDISRNLTGGVSVKIFSSSQTSTGEDPYEINSNNALLFDAGLLYTVTGITTPEQPRDKFSIGLSVQNLGTDYKEESAALFNGSIAIPLPKYFRAGFAYALGLTLGQKTRTAFDLLVTGEYHNLLNATSFESTERDYWGYGIEAALFKIISVRLGGSASPEQNILFDKGKLYTRYGIGLNIPITGFILNGSFNLRFNYASIPINKTDFEGGKNSLYSFGVSLTYGAPAFIK